MSLLSTFKGMPLVREIRNKVGHNGNLSKFPVTRGAENPPRPLEEMGRIERHFWQNTGRYIDKWHHYLPVYDRHFAPYADSEVRVLEIGVQNGGSMDMWRQFFGPKAQLMGIDVDPRCAELDGKSATIRIGSQADTGFLEQVISELGGVDLVIDDGSHRMDHIRESFRYLFPKVSPDGIYLIEDLHTAYWSAWGGGFRQKSNFFRDISLMIDDLHAQYHERPQHFAETSLIGGIHVYDSMVIFDREDRKEPQRSVTGTMDR